MSFTCELEEFATATKYFFPPFDLDSAGESDCVFCKGEHFLYKTSPQDNACDFRIPCFFLSYPVLRMKFESIHSECMGLYWWIVYCSLYFAVHTLAVTKTCGSPEHFIYKVPVVWVFFFFSPHHLITVAAAGKRK